MDEAINDENSMVSLNSKTMETLHLFRGDTILIKVVLTPFCKIAFFLLLVWVENSVEKFKFFPIVF